MADLALHPTVKPVSLIADALRDVSGRGEIVLDGFGGSGSTLIAAGQDRPEFGPSERLGWPIRQQEAANVAHRQRNLLRGVFPGVHAQLSVWRQPSWLLRSSATDAACLRRPSVVVVEPAQHREGHDAPAGLYAARPLPLVRDPLPDPLVRSPPVEVSHPFGEHAA